MNSTPPPVPRKSGAKGCLIGGAVGCLIVLLVAGVLVFVGIRFAKSQYEALMHRFEREGYQKVEGQVIDVTERITEPTIFVGQLVRIRAGSTRGLAMLCQNAELDGDIAGNVHFIGQVLTVNKTAHLLRDLDVKAQVVNVYGTVDGKITGVYQQLNKTPP